MGSKQTIAWLVNRDYPQDEQKRGHHWEARYANRRLETGSETITNFLYIDLQQVKARMADSVESSSCSAIQRQIEAHARVASQDVHHREPSQREGDAQELEGLNFPCRTVLFP